MRTRLLVACHVVCLIGLTLITPTAASAEQLYSTGVSPASRFSELHQPLAESFTLTTSAGLTNIVWWGGYGFSGTTPPPVEWDDFTIQVYADAGSKPGNLIATYPVGDTATRDGTSLSTTPQSGAPVALFRYSYALTASLGLSAGTTYWISIRNGGAWAWSMANPSDSRYYVLGCCGWLAQVGDLAFALEGHPPFTLQFTGFTEPITMGIINLATAGKVIPSAWRITDLSGAPVNDAASFGGLFSFEVSCGSTETSDPIEEYAAGSSGLQSLGDGYWQFNWKTDKAYAKKCRRMYIKLGDGQMSDQVLFQFK
jgi:hypothetical protein